MICIWGVICGGGAVMTEADIDWPTADDLLTLERTAEGAFARRSVDGLNVIGFGEVSIALGYPTDDPAFVCKRSPPLTPGQADRYRSLLVEYLEALDGLGVTVAESKLMTVAKGDEVVLYIVQPMLPTATLADNVLRGDEPSADHPLLVALCGALDTVGPRCSIDAQISNWSWDGSALTLLDIGSPMLWDDDGTTRIDLSPYMALLPRPIRGTVERDLMELTKRWQTPRGVALDLVANLYRVELEHWLDAVLEALNGAIEPDEPITAAEARVLFEDDLKTWPRMKRMAQLQRAWQTRVRRKPYEFFIQNSYTGEIV